MEYHFIELLTFFLIYSFLGWCLEVMIVAIKERRFRNRGFINLPFCLMYGFVMDILVILWPRMEEHIIFRFFMVFAVFVMVQSLSEFTTVGICKRMLWKYEDMTPYHGKGKNFVVALFYTLILYSTVLLLHPFIYFAVDLLPNIVLKTISIIISVLVLCDLMVTFLLVFFNRNYVNWNSYQEKSRNQLMRLNKAIYHRIWSRIERAYPHWEELEGQEKAIFAKGICFDKILWVFMISALLGDLIETIYCRIVAGVWMSRSSVLYGPFSIVWGIGAVVLTIALSKFAEKEDRYIFFLGALLGGVYEYMCSVFTELVFGTVYWDYSKMPLNIGGRTNVLFMLFWGILSVVWIKFCYPKMSNAIEKLPILAGKIITWVLIAFMICNALLSAFVVIRYTKRQEGKKAQNTIEVFIDENYQDDLVEKVWPNMRIRK